MYSIVVSGSVMSIVVSDVSPWPSIVVVFSIVCSAMGIAIDFVSIVMNDAINPKSVAYTTWLAAVIGMNISMWCGRCHNPKSILSIAIALKVLNL